MNRSLYIFQISNHKFQIRDFKFQISNFRFQIVYLSLGEKTRLRRRGGFSPGDAHDAEDSHLGQGRSRNEDFDGRAVKVRRGNLNPAVQKREQIVGYYTFDAFVVAELEAHPKAVKLGPGKECFALGFKIVLKFTHEIDAAHVLDRNIAVLTVRCKQVYGVRVPEFPRIQVASQRLSLKQKHDDFLERGGWGA